MSKNKKKMPETLYVYYDPEIETYIAAETPEEIWNESHSEVVTALVYKQQGAIKITRNVVVEEL